MSRVTFHSKSSSLGVGPPPPPPPEGGVTTTTGPVTTVIVTSTVAVARSSSLASTVISYVSCVAISKVVPKATVIWPLSGSISNENASMPEWLYVSVSPASTSVASTGAPTSSRCSALSDTRRAGMDSRNVGASFSGSTVSATVATLEVRPPESVTR